MKDGQCHGKGVFQYADGDRCAQLVAAAFCGFRRTLYPAWLRRLAAAAAATATRANTWRAR